MDFLPCKVTYPAEGGGGIDGESASRQCEVDARQEKEEVRSEGGLIICQLMRGNFINGELVDRVTYTRAIARFQGVGHGANNIEEDDLADIEVDEAANNGGDEGDNEAYEDD